MGGRGSNSGMSQSLSVGAHMLREDGGLLVYHIYPNVDTISIKGLEVTIENRGKGVGSRLLKKMTDLSDKSGRPLELLAVPIRSKMTVNDLMKWYKKRGFKPDGDGQWMKYTPRKRN